MLAEIAPAATSRRRHVRALFAYAWPRNVRELVRALERAVALAGTGRDRARAPARRDRDREVHRAGRRRRRDARRDELVALLEKHQGNVSKVAVELGRVRQQVQRWLKRYGLDPERYRT